MVVYTCHPGVRVSSSRSDWAPKKRKLCSASQLRCASQAAGSQQCRCAQLQPQPRQKMGDLLLLYFGGTKWENMIFQAEWVFQIGKKKKKSTCSLSLTVISPEEPFHMLIIFPILTYLNSKTVPSWPGCLELQLFFSISSAICLLAGASQQGQDVGVRSTNTHLPSYQTDLDLKTNTRVWNEVLLHLKDAPARLTQDKCLSLALCTVCKGYAVTRE